MMEKKTVKVAEMPRGFALVNEDLLQNILSRLPALSFASAACVNHCWNHICNHILSRPKLLSAVSLNPSLQGAVEEVFNKVLSEPIRPHFAIACIGLEFVLVDAHKLIRKRLGSKTPIITSVASGIIGRDALKNDFREVKWGENDSSEFNLAENMNRGIMLTVGFVPGLKVDAIPLIQSVEDPHVTMVDKFVMDIRDYTASVSGSTSPAAIIMFGDEQSDMKPVLDKLDYAMSTETVIVGDEKGRFENGNGDCSTKMEAVALVFARDRGKPQGIGEIQFHVSLSTGVTPVGPMHKAVSVRAKGTIPDCSTWLTARREGLDEILDGQRILNDIDDQMEERFAHRDLYIGVTKRRKCSIGPDRPGPVTFLSFHEVLGGDEEYLYVDGDGIKTGDVFHFYSVDPVTASSSCDIVSENFRNLRREWDNNGDKNQVCGGIIFTCYGRGESFCGRENADSSPFLENFPGISLAGVFCGGEIGRGYCSSVEQQVEEVSKGRCCLHVYSAVYLVMSYTGFS